MKRKFILKDDFIRQRAMQAVKEATEGMEVIIKPPSRSLDQNAKIHAMFSDLASQIDWHGMKLHADVWKRLCTAAMLRELGESPTLIPSIDGRGVEIIYEKTSRMSKKMMADLIEWVFAFGAEKGVVWGREAA